MILVDTDVLIEILDKGSKKGDKALARIEESKEDVAITSLTMHEVLYGIHKYGKTKKEEKIKLIETLPFDKKDASLSSKIEIGCERRGRKISRMDSMIAAIAINSGAKFFTFNRKHFEEIPELNLFKIFGSR